MTVPVQIPIVEFIGNGTTTKFSFVWSSTAITDIEVFLNKVLQGFQTDFTIDNYTEENGGDVVFATPPAATDGNILIKRKTPITQQLDYTAAPFPSDTHEDQFDKDTYILQELILGGVGTLGFVNLAAVPGANFVDIINTGGTDARIPAWTNDGLKAGIFFAEVTTSAPADGSASTKPEGFVYIEI